MTGETEELAEEIAEETVGIISERIGMLEERIRNLENATIETGRIVKEKYAELLKIIQEIKEEISSMRKIDEKDESEFE